MKVKVYVEGGGDGKDLRTKCRRGFSSFFEKADLVGRMPQVIACGGRAKAFDADSGRNWTAIPDETGHRFRWKLDTDSGPKWTVIAVAGRPRSGCSPERFGGADPRSGATRDNPPTVGPFLVFGEGPRWRIGGCPCARYERFCGCTTPQE